MRIRRSPRYNKIKKGWSPNEVRIQRARRTKESRNTQRNKIPNMGEMCIDFTDINEACPKDCYSLPEIDWKVDSLSNFKLECFLDAYKSYNQIHMAKDTNIKQLSKPQKEYTTTKRCLSDSRTQELHTREKPLLFFKTLKGYMEKKDFTWTREAYKAFEEMKKYIEKLPTLVGLKAGESLIVYLATSRECISAVLMPERGKTEHPYISRLKRYFQAHKITVLTNRPIRLLLLKPKRSGRVARWTIELKEHEIEFKPTNAIRPHILADFLAETQEEDDETDFQGPEKKGDDNA
nr:hypothetical protein [Tanacetum cinerariifolium]